MKKMNNKGFSLVELIVVIAIMAVLVGVLAPQFIKYVESSRRSTDISNAQNIQSAILADIANNVITSGSGLTLSTGSGGSGTNVSSIGEVLMNKGNPAGAAGTVSFVASYNVSAGTCHVNLGTFTLTTSSGAEEYKHFGE